MFTLSIQRHFELWGPGISKYCRAGQQQHASGNTTLPLIAGIFYWITDVTFVFSQAQPFNINGGRIALLGEFRLFLLTYLIYDLKIGKACDCLTGKEVVLPARVVSFLHRRILNVISRKGVFCSLERMYLSQ